MKKIYCTFYTKMLLLTPVELMEYTDTTSTWLHCQPLDLQASSCSENVNRSLMSISAANKDVSGRPQHLWRAELAGYGDADQPSGWWYRWLCTWLGAPAHFGCGDKTLSWQRPSGFGSISSGSSSVDEIDDTFTLPVARTFCSVCHLKDSITVFIRFLLMTLNLSSAITLIFPRFTQKATQ